MASIASIRRGSAQRWWLSLPVPLGLLLLLHAPGAQASLLEGDALDTAANIVSWIAIIIVPVVLLAAFWWVHIMPEKIAEKRHHPQLPAIKIVCLLSLVFGGMLWPIAWVWAYTKPVLHKIAYGTDREAPHPPGDAVHLEAEPLEPVAPPAPVAVVAAPSEDIDLLKRRIASLEMQLAAASAQAVGRGTTGSGGT